jgi:hypothetical protein
MKASEFLVEQVKLTEYISDLCEDEITIESFGELHLEEGDLCEAMYRGRKVTLNKPTRGDVKKFKVYVTHPKTGKVVKVNFGDPDMTIKKHIPARRRSFRARHKCDKNSYEKDRHTQGYWSCRQW